MTTNYIEVSTGEIIDIDTSSDRAIVKSWQFLSDQIKELEKAKDQLKDLIRRQELDDREIDGYMFKVSGVQRRNYDLETMRNVLDEDLFNTFIQADKKLVDSWVEENIEIDPDTTEQLRKNMVDVGQPYTVLKLQKVSL